MGLLMIQGYLSSAGKSRNSHVYLSLILIHGVPLETARHIGFNYKLIDAVSFCQNGQNLISKSMDYVKWMCPLDGIYNTKLVGEYVLNYDYLIKRRCLKFEINAFRVVISSLNDLKNSVPNLKEKPQLMFMALHKG